LRRLRDLRAEGWGYLAGGAASRRASNSGRGRWLRGRRAIGVMGQESAWKAPIRTTPASRVLTIRPLDRAGCGATAWASCGKLNKDGWPTVMYTCAPSGITNSIEQTLCIHSAL
jgi:hypothetical protein